MSGWYCMGCGCDRALEDFGQPCHCGSYAMALDEEHRFTLAELERFRRDWEEVRQDER